MKRLLELVPVRACDFVEDIRNLFPIRMVAYEHNRRLGRRVVVRVIVSLHPRPNGLQDQCVMLSRYGNVSLGT